MKRNKFLNFNKYKNKKDNVRVTEMHQIPNPCSKM